MPDAGVAMFRAAASLTCAKSLSQVMTTTTTTTASDDDEWALIVAYKE